MTALARTRIATAMAFQFASTNLVFEIGIVMWIFLGWEFTLAEFLGGLILIPLMWAGIRLFVTRRLEENARAHAQAAESGHEHRMAGSEELSLRQRLTSVRAWSDVAHNFRGDWQMLYKEITIGFLLAGFIALLGDDFFNGLFLTDAPAAVQPPTIGRAPGTAEHLTNDASYGASDPAQELDHVAPPCASRL
jgi:hypothetical protein